jgi:hypothetical protein
VCGAVEQAVEHDEVMSGMIRGMMSGMISGVNTIGANCGSERARYFGGMDGGVEQVVKHDEVLDQHVPPEHQVLPVHALSPSLTHPPTHSLCHPLTVSVQFSFPPLSFDKPPRIMARCSEGPMGPIARRTGASRGSLPGLSYPELPRLS